MTNTGGASLATDSTSITTVTTLTTDVEVTNSDNLKDHDQLKSDSQSQGNKDQEENSQTQTMDDLLEMMNDENWTCPTPGPSTTGSRERSGRAQDSEVVDGSAAYTPATSTRKATYDAFRGLIQDVKTLKNSANPSAIKFGNLGLCDRRDCSQWIQSEFKDAEYGLIIDPLVLLDRIFGDEDMDNATFWDNLVSRQNLGIETGAEAIAITSLNYSRPRLFHKGRETMTCDRSTSRLNRLLTPEAWKTAAGDGVGHYITHRMYRLQSCIETHIANVFSKSPHSQGRRIASLSLMASVSFVARLVYYIDSLFEQLQVHSKCTVEIAWSLTMQILDKIMSDLYRPKFDAMNSMSFDRSSICAHILWASFRCHDVAQKYLDSNFEEHPAVSSLMIKFLMANSGSEKVQVEKLTKQVEILEGELATVRAKSDT